MASPIEVGEPIEGEIANNVDYYFERIGESLPIKPPPFDYANNLPSQPLAVSDLHGALFLALPDSGFCVARTKDVVALATSSSSNSVQQSSVAEVPVGNVGILALSFDQSTLAASVGEQIHFFSVPSLLLSKGLEPSNTESVDGSSFVKDVRWRKKRSRNSYLVLSDSGKLYRGALDSPMEHVMDDVHAVDWSVEGNQIALAKKDTLTIVSSKFKERWSMLLPFDSWVGDSGPSCSVKVDSIKWVRSDSIVVGCFQLTEDGNEENYLVQVIRSAEGNISDVSSSCKPVVTNFYDLFAGVVDDILPFGSGPYLLMSYLDQLDIAITANKKNTDQHIAYLGWSLGEEENKVKNIHIGRDKWLPRIELQENDDDNSILALCIDKNSCFGKLKVLLATEEQSELSPCYVLICLTLEGKLTIFNMASVRETAVSSPDGSVVSEEEDDATESVPVESEVIQSSIGLRNKQQNSLGLELQDWENEKVEKEGNNEIFTEKDLDPIDINKSPVSLSFPAELSDKQISKHSMEASISSHAFEAGGKQNVRIEPMQPFGGGSSNLEQTLNKSPFPLEQTFGFGNTPASSAHSRGSFFNVAKEQVSPVKAGFSSMSSSSSKFSFGNSVSTNVGLPLLSSYTQGDGSENANLNATKFGANIAVVSTSPQKPSNEEHDPLPAPANIESIPSMRGSYISSRDIGTAGSSMHQRHYPLKENHRNLPQSGILNSEPVLSKHFGNIEDMTKELDMLLRSIEQPGGFRDVCTLSQKSSVEALEQGIQSLSDRYRKCMGIVDERLIDVQNLLDETVRVLARKIYMEGIVKQASDNQYMDLWNRQKLSPDLELKRRHILKLNEILTNQLIELERHFNSIELNKFGESGGIFADKRRTQSRHGSSRQIQSFHSIQNTMSSQLAAAEKLADCLSSQMSMLKVDSPLSKRKNVKKELFETIGIPYDASFSSPSVSKAGDKSPSEGKFLLSGGSTVAKEKSRGKSSVSKVYERETARRRRDSLDQSWASYEPPKTTVKRLLLQESQKPSLPADRQILSSHLLERSRGAQPYSNAASTLSLFGTRAGRSGEPANEISGNQGSPFLTDNQQSVQFSGFKSSTVQRKQLSSLASAEGQRLTMGTTTSNTSFGSGLTSNVKSDALGVKETKSFLQSGTNIQQTPSFSTKETVPWSSPVDSTKIKPSATTPFSGFGRKLESSISLPFAASNAGVSKVLLDEKVSAFPAFSVSSASPSLQLTPNRSSETLSSTTPTSQLFTSSHTTAEEKNLTKTPSSFFPSTVAPDALSFQSRKQATLPSFSSPTKHSTLELQASGKADDESDVEPKPLASTTPFIRLSTPSKADLGTMTPSKGEFDLGTTIQPSKSDLATSTQASTMIPTPSEGKFDLGTIQLSKSETGVPIQPSKSDTGVTIQPSKSDTGGTIQASTALPAPSFNLGTTIQTSKSDFGSSTTLPNTSKGALDLGATPSKFPTFSNNSTPSSNTASKSTFNQPSFAPTLFQTQVATSASVAGIKTENPIVSTTNDDDMDEEAPESNTPTTELAIGSLGGFGLGSVPNPNAPKANPFGGSFGNSTTNITPPPFTMNVPSGELFRPASFSFQSPQSANAFSGGFGTGTSTQAPAPSGGFGQPSQIGQGQQALGSVLGSFGQSRQLGSSPVGGGFGGSSPPSGGLASAAPVSGGFGGFGGLSASSGGFGSLASGSGGFGGAASIGGGFAGAASGGGGFAAAASGGGFGAFSGQGGGTSGFSTFGSNTAATGKPPELFTQMRK